MNPSEMIGKKFGRLTVVADGKVNRHREKICICRCECGKMTASAANKLIRGTTRSCGCLMIKHGHTLYGNRYSRTYQCWQAIIRRTNNKNSTGYKNYGGRGIRVCLRWKKFVNFIKDMGERPSPEHSIERIDNNKGYYPYNCQWATTAEQSRNRRNNRTITFNGKTMILQDWSVATGIHRETISSRIDSGWTIKDALTRAPRRMA